MSKILEEVERIISKIYNSGISINKTREIQNEIIEFEINNINIAEEEEEIKKYYDKNIEPYEERKQLEKTHYDRIRADIKHEITRHQWFSNHDKIFGIEDFLDKSKELLDEKQLLELNKIKYDIIEEMKLLNNFSSRRNVVFSLDCISYINLLVRSTGNTFTVVIRSSDAYKLLSIDILEMIKIYNEVVEEFNIKKTSKDKIVFLINSCHLYDKDEEKIKKNILKIIS